MEYLDGKRLRQAVRAGSNWLAQNRDRLNAINVFPVADGDTGTNMVLTLQAAVVGAEAQAVADDHPEQANQAQRREAHHHCGKEVLAAHHAAVK